MTIALIVLITAIVFLAGYLLWKSRDTWRWFQLTAAAITLILAIVILFPTAGVLKSRRAWNKVKEDLDARLAKVEAEQALLQYGDPNDPASGVGVLDLQSELQRFSIEAGRRWPNLRVETSAVASVTLSSVAAQAVLPPGVEPEPPPAGAAAAGGAAAPAAPAQPLIPTGSVVYGFAETVEPGAAAPVPTFYLGEFRVTASTPTQVTLAPTGTLEDAQQQAITSGRAQTWSLYEMLPLDGHQPFIAVGSEPTDDALFGRVDDELVKRLLAGASEATINEYLRDGSRSRADDPPATRWLKIEFVKPFTIVVDSPGKRDVLDGGFFDVSGQAVDSRLQRGGENGAVSFKTSDQIVVKEDAANELIEQGVAKLLDTYFVRPLNDYRFVLRRVRLRISELAIREKELLYEQQVLTQSIDATKAMSVAHQEAKLKLENDVAKIQIETAAIKDYTAKVSAKVAATREQLVGVYRENLQLEKQLEDIHFNIKTRLP